MAIPFPKEATPYGEQIYWDQRYNDDRKKHGQKYSFEW